MSELEVIEQIIGARQKQVEVLIDIAYWLRVMCDELRDVRAAIEQTAQAVSDGNR